MKEKLDSSTAGLITPLVLSPTVTIHFTIQDTQENCISTKKNIQISGDFVSGIKANDQFEFKSILSQVI